MPRNHLDTSWSTQPSSWHIEAYLIPDRLSKVILPVALTIIFKIPDLIAKVIERLKLLPRAMFLVIMGTMPAVVTSH